MTEDEEDDGSIDSMEEGLQLLLGGLSSREMLQVQGWDATCTNLTLSGPTDHNQRTRIPNETVKNRSDPAQTKLWDSSIALDQKQQDPIQQLAHYNSTSDGRLLPPPVSIAYMGQDRGYGLVARQAFLKDDVIFVEQAVVVASGSKKSGKKYCSHCCKSLVTMNEVSSELPLPHLWPVEPNLISCSHCGAFYCSLYCQKQHRQQYGSCCRLETCLRMAHDEEESATALATLLLVMSVHQQKSPASLEGLCGDPKDLTALELGEAIRDETTGLVTYTVERLYKQLCEILNISPSQQEQESFSLQTFAHWTAMAARNGVGGATSSPFGSYYSGLIRSAGGRGTLQHQILAGRVSQALGGMTREVNARVEEQSRVAFSGIFPLAARINHACVYPTAHIESEAFTSAHVQVVASQNIAVGQEITISYLSPHYGNGIKRRKALKERYLFECYCDICKSGG